MPLVLITAIVSVLRIDFRMSAILGLVLLSLWLIHILIVSRERLIFRIKLISQLIEKI